MINHKQFQISDIQEFVSLTIKENLLTEGMKDPKHVKWKFCENPCGKTNYFYLSYKNKIVGRILSSQYPGKIYINQEKFNSFCLSDLYLKKENRAPFTNLIKLYNECIENTNGIIFHSSNNNSENLYKKILKKKIWFHLYSYGLPVSINVFSQNNLIIKNIFKVFLFLYLKTTSCINHILGKLLNLKLLIKKENFETDIFEINNELKKYYNIFDRSLDFLKWRYLIYDYKYCLILKKKNKTIGYILFVNSNAMNLKNLIIMDFAFTKNLNFFEKIYYKSTIVRIAENEKFDTIYTMGNKGSGMLNNLIGFPFFKIPDSYLPHSNPMFIHNAKNIDENEIKRIHFTISDFDYF